MAITSSLKLGLDLPVWEWLRFQPIGATAAGWCTCTNETGNDRYLYFLGTTFYRYDTYTDGWQQLATPNTALSTVGVMRYVGFNGFHARSLGTGSATTIHIPALNGLVFVNNSIDIVEGTGKGQSRTISSVTDPTIWDQGMLTTATATQLTDTTKKWKFNQWAGYQVRLTYAAGASQIRVILYNDATNLYLSDTNYQAIDSWNNTGFSAVTPYAAPVATAGAQTYYVIESSVATISPAWDVVPDITSKIVINSGGIWFVSSAAGAPFFTLQYYDVARDAWFTKTANATLLSGVLGTDVSLEKFIEGSGYFDSGSFTNTSSAAPLASLVDSERSWPIDRYTNYQVRIVSGSGIGQQRRIIAMSGSYLQTERRWDSSLDTSSIYGIYGDTDKMLMFPGANSAILQYNIDSDMWGLGDSYYTGIARNMSVKWYNSSSYEQVGLTAVSRSLNGILSMSVTVGGSGYRVGDVFNVISASAQAGKGRVTSVGYSGSVSSSVFLVELYACGLGYNMNAPLTTTNILGTGVGLTVNVLTGSVARVRTGMNHWFQRGDYIAISGTNDPSWNVRAPIIGCDSLTAFDITMSANPTLFWATASSTQGNNTLVDSAMSWSVNELVGKIVQKSLVGAAGTSEAKRILSNTSNSMVVQSNWTANPVNATGRYIIYDPQSFGREEQYRVPYLNGRGYASGGTSSMMYDVNKNWDFNQWSGSRIRFVAGVGMGNELTVSYNTPNTLSFTTTQSFSPDVTTKYILMDTFGLAAAGSNTTGILDLTKNWTINQFAGKRCRITSGTGISQEFSITSNTLNTITMSAVTTGPTGDSTYVIYSPAVKGAGIAAQWIWGTTVPNAKGKYIWVPIGGGSNRFDRYDITTGLWDYGIFIEPITETLNTGTMYTYDGVDNIYFTNNATGRVFRLDLTTYKVIPIGITPYAQGAAVIGNRMEIVDTPDGLRFLIIFRHTGQEVWRTLLFT